MALIFRLTFMELMLNQRHWLSLLLAWEKLAWMCTPLRKGTIEIRHLLVGDPLDTLEVFAKKDFTAGQKRYPMKGFFQGAVARSDAFLQDTITLQGLAGRLRRKSDGRIDWFDCGPQRDLEWAWMLNRLAFLDELALAYHHTGQSRYLEAANAVLLDWLRASRAPRRRCYSPQWRPLEAAKRLLTCLPRLLFHYWRHPAIADETRRLLVYSLHEHGQTLMRYHAREGNHKITEMAALLMLSVYWPEFKQASTWRQYALDALEKEYDRQVYPDGAHKELSSHYQRVVAMGLQVIPPLLADAGELEASEAWEERRLKLWSYLWLTVQPSGYSPLNNDGASEHVHYLLKEHAKELLQSEPPPAFVSAWAGHWVTRYPQPRLPGSPLRCFFFDYGPAGIGHDHNDKLHCNLSLGPWSLLVDNGRYHYKNSPWRRYFTGPAAHNVVCFPGLVAQSMPPETLTPLPEPLNDTLSATRLFGARPKFADVKARASHQRTVHASPEALHVRDELWVASPRQAVTYWHCHPGCTVETLAEGAAWQIRNGPCALVLRLDTDAPATSRVVSGQETPEIQGWYSSTYYHKTPAPCIVIQQALAGTVTNAWAFEFSLTE